MAGAADGPPGMHTAEEAAEILKVRPSWLERQAAARKIPFTMLGGSYRFTDRHLAEIVRMHEFTPAPKSPDLPSPARSRRNTGTTAVMAAVGPLRPRPRNGPRRVG